MLLDLLFFSLCLAYFLTSFSSHLNSPSQRDLPTLSYLKWNHVSFSIVLYSLICCVFLLSTHHHVSYMYMYICICMCIFICCCLSPSPGCLYLLGICRFTRVGLSSLSLHYLLNDCLLQRQGFCPGRG